MESSISTMGAQAEPKNDSKISVIVIVDVDTKQGYTLLAQQTSSAQPESKKAKKAREKASTKTKPSKRLTKQSKVVILVKR